MSISTKKKTAAPTARPDEISEDDVLKVLKSDPGHLHTAAMIVAALKRDAGTFDLRAQVIRIATRLEEKGKAKSGDVQAEIGWRTGWFVPPPPPHPAHGRLTAQADPVFSRRFSRGSPILQPEAAPSTRATMSSPRMAAPLGNDRGANPP